MISNLKILKLEMFTSIFPQNNDIKISSISSADYKEQLQKDNKEREEKELQEQEKLKKERDEKQKLLLKRNSTRNYFGDHDGQAMITN